MIRIAEPCDAEKMLAIYAGYILNSAASFEYTVPSGQEFYQRMQETQPEFPWLVYEKDGLVAGYAYASRTFGRAAYKWNASVSIYVSEKYHGTGIAASLYECIEEFMRVQGYYYLYAGITSSNIASLRFVEKYGFIKTAAYPNSGFKLGEWHDVIWLYKTLREPEGTPSEPEQFSNIDVQKVKNILEKSK